ncbi:MAG: hypothetical protein AVDCRST_MAG91-103, partial [uncultured Sphingomonadaceae bacterium]
WISPAAMPECEDCGWSATWHLRASPAQAVTMSRQSSRSAASSLRSLNRILCSRSAISHLSASGGCCSGFRGRRGISTSY